ncbi:chaplin family protein [Dactylosporangium sucinum]|uniref:Chaplin domain-containing protein n=1 Tax=Dactylosporangium sucinum TaxID=1424081 RepID=A0A917U1I3_9ACTN|nr:chaplin family protein [Dactylosporangium sucinum]GGM50661.1 hypothetical protein GCM10007977_060520 [Dactylosporangium sucinum]
MKTWVRKSLNVGVLSAGFLLVSGGAAHADWTTGYNAGLLNGNQFDTTVQVPINLCGNSIALLGFADASCGGGAVAWDAESATATESATTEDWTTGYNVGLANGNQFDTTLQVPVNVCGNSVALLGFSSANCGGGATAIDGNVAMADDKGHKRKHRGGNGGGQGSGNGNGDYTEGVGNRTEDWTSGFNVGALNGNQFDTTAQLPINVAGNSLALLGFSSASSAGGSWAVKGESARAESATTEDWTTGYNAGLLNGNQFDTTLQLPINLCGNSIAILGFSSASCGGGAVAVDGGAGSGHGNGHGHGGNGGGWGDDDDDQGNGNGGYGGADANGYGNGNGGSNAYSHAAGDASGVMSNASHGKVAHKASKAKKKNKSQSINLGEHGTRHGTGTANDNGYGANANNNGYGNGNANNNGGGYGDNNGSGWGDDDDDNGWGGGDRGGRRHHGGGMGGAKAVKGGCSDWTTGYNAGLLNGNQFDTTLQVPINISGNSLSILGLSQAQSAGGAVAYSC